MRNSPLRDNDDEQLQKELLSLKTACMNAKKDYKALKAKYKALLALVNKDKSTEKTKTKLAPEVENSSDPFLAMTYLLQPKPFTKNGKKEEIKKNMGRIKRIQRSRTINVTPNDLTKIVGIGPKIQSLLNKSGVMTFDDLAQKTIKQLQQLLDRAGKGYKNQDPTNWPKSALQLKLK